MKISLRDSENPHGCQERHLNTWPRMTECGAWGAKMWVRGAVRVLLQERERRGAGKKGLCILDLVIIYVLKFYLRQHYLVNLMTPFSTCLELLRCYSVYFNQKFITIVTAAPLIIIRPRGWAGASIVPLPRNDARKERR